MLEKRPCVDAGKVLVTFRISHRIWADKIALVGDFDGWSQKALSLIQSVTDPDWHTTLELDAGKRYRYRYVLDGCGWNTDNHADDYITDSAGQEYCVLLPDMTSVEPISSPPASVYRVLSLQFDTRGIEAVQVGYLEPLTNGIGGDSWVLQDSGDDHIAGIGGMGRGRNQARKDVVIAGSA